MTPRATTRAGELAGRKFYLDRADAYTGEPWKDDSETNRLNDRSTLALEASKPGRRFRFTLRFRDLDPAELAAVLVALCPDQFKGMLGGAHADGYCSKLGYAGRWVGAACASRPRRCSGSRAAEAPTMIPEPDLATWVRENYTKTALQDEWLAIHRRKHPDAADYPRRRRRDLHLPHDTPSRALAGSPIPRWGRVMTTLLILTVGQTDVQLVIDGVRHELEPKKCGVLHDEIKRRGYRLVDVPAPKDRQRQDALPEGDLTLCTPKLDAALRYFEGNSPPAAALIFDTRRALPSDPRLGGAVLERRLNERGVQVVRRHALLTGEDLLENPNDPQDAVVRREVVQGVAQVLATKFAEVKPGNVVVATTGGLAAANAVIEELVRLHAVGSASVQVLEVPDGAFTAQNDRAVPERFHPAAGYRARWQALALIEGGNLLGAWGAVSHLRTSRVRSGRRSSAGCGASPPRCRCPATATSRYSSPRAWQRAPRCGSSSPSAQVMFRGASMARWHSSRPRCGITSRRT